jgi:hypothetical protein
MALARARPDGLQCLIQTRDMLKRMSDAAKRITANFSTKLADVLSLRNERLFSVVLILSIAPLWFGQKLPMIDLPQHAAQVAALQQIWSGNEAFTQAFQVNWFTPYLLGYLLLYVLSLLVPVAVATQIVVALAIMSVPLLSGLLLRVAGADERWKWLAIPGGFSFAFYWGFLSFMVAVPFALFFLIQTIRFVRAPTLKSGIGIAVFALFLFFCHIVVLGFASLVALGYVVGCSYRDLRGLALRVLPFAIPLPLIALWLLITYANEPAVRSAPMVYGFGLERFVALLVQPSGREMFSPWISLMVTGSVAWLPFLAGARLSRRPERWLPFVLGLLAFLTFPAYAMNTGFLYQRLGVFLVPLWLMAWDPPSGRARNLDQVAMLVVVVWAFSNIGRFAAFVRETESFDDIIAAMEPDRTVASMVVDSSSPLFAGPVYMHFPAWYQAKHRGIVDFNFADFHSQMARYKSTAGPRIVEQLAWFPSAFLWGAHGGDKYDYFIVKANFDVSNEIFKEKRSAVRLVARSGWWWLYRNVERDVDHRLDANESLHKR